MYKLIRGITAHSNNIRSLYSTTFLKAVKSIPNSEEPVRLEKTINSVQLLGRVGADPVLKGTQEHPVAIFSLATHTNYRYDTGEFVQRTEWHRVLCFKPGLRETIMNFLKKGQRIHVTGKITYGEVKGEDGKPRSTTAIQADDVIFFHHSSANVEKQSES